MALIIATDFYSGAIFVFKDTDFSALTPTASEVKTLYESNADTNVFTDAEKSKLSTLSEHFLGTYVSLAALQTAHPTANAGDYARVDGGVGEDVNEYIWDIDDVAWIKQLGKVYNNKLIFVQVAGNYTVKANEWVGVTTAGADKTMFFPVAPIKDDLVKFTKDDSAAGKVLLNGNGKNINGSPTDEFSNQYTVVTYQYNGTEWRKF